MKDDIIRFIGQLLRVLLSHKWGQEFLSNLFNLAQQNMLLTIAIIFVAIIVISAIAGSISSNSSLPSSTTNPTFSPSTTNSPSRVLAPIPDDIQNILRDIVKDDIRDPVSQEKFRSREKIHLCTVHRLAYHEDSWQEMGCKCITCGHGGNTKNYTLPTPRNEIGWINLK